MSSINEEVQKRLRQITGTAFQFEGDWHAYLDIMSIPTGMVMERILAQAQKQDGAISTASAALAFFSDPTRIKYMTPYYLDARRNDASFAIPATPTTFVWNNEVADTLNAYNNTTGVLTIPFTGIYVFVFMYNAKTTASNKTIYSAAEVFNGSIWVPAADSCRPDSVLNAEQENTTFVSVNRFVKDTQLRFPTWASVAGVTINTEAPTGGPTFQIPAARLLIGGIPTE